MVLEDFYTVVNCDYSPAGVIDCDNIKRRHSVIRYVFAVRLKDILGNTITLDVTNQINDALRDDGYAINSSNAYLFKASFKEKKVLLSDDHCKIKDIGRCLPPNYELKKNKKRS